MDLSTTLEQVRSWSVPDRLRLVQAILDTIADDEDAVALSDADKAELDRRLAELDAAPEDVLTWDEIKASIREKK